MADNVIVRGTTPSLIIDFSGVTEIPDFNVEDESDGGNDA